MTPGASCTPFRDFVAAERWSASLTICGTCWGESCLGWEIAFELRLKRARHVRIYADVLVITEDRVFSLEFKMKDKIDPDEALEQAAKYCAVSGDRLRAEV